MTEITVTLTNHDTGKTVTAKIDGEEALVIIQKAIDEAVGEAPRGQA